VSIKNALQNLLTTIDRRFVTVEHKVMVDYEDMLSPWALSYHSEMEAGRTAKSNDLCARWGIRHVPTWSKLCGVETMIRGRFSN
jgi:hypothetical protein